MNNLKATEQAGITVRLNGEIIGFISDGVLYKCEEMKDKEIADLINMIDIKA